MVQIGVETRPDRIADWLDYVGNRYDCAVECFGLLLLPPMRPGRSLRSVARSLDALGTAASIRRNRPRVWPEIVPYPAMSDSLAVQNSAAGFAAWSPLHPSIAWSVRAAWGAAV